MSYKEQVDAYFKRFKPSDRTQHLKMVILTELDDKYHSMIDHGFMKHEAEAELSRIASNLRGHYPILNSLPVQPIRGSNTGRTARHVYLGLFVVVSVGLYIWIPLLSIIPHYVIAIAMLVYTNESDAAVQPGRRNLFLELLALMAFQTVALTLRYPLEEMIWLAVFGDGMMILVFTFGYLLFRKHDREFPKQPIVAILITGPRPRNVNTTMFLSFMMCSGLIFGLHFFLALVHMATN